MKQVHKGATGTTAATIHVTPSRLLCVWIVALAAVSIVLCSRYLPSTIAVFPVTAIVLIGAYLVARDALLIMPNSVIGMRMDAGGCEIVWRSAKLRSDRGWAVHHTSFVGSWLTVIVLSSAGAEAASRCILILPDSVESSTFRRLRVWLRWKAGGGSKVRSDGSSVF